MKNKLIMSILIMFCYGNCVTVTIHKAAKDGQLEVIKDLLKDGVDVNRHDETGGTALHYAVYYSQFKTARYLIAHGANINAKWDKGWTPLHLATGIGNLEIVEHLIEKGADVNAKGALGWTPLHIGSKMIEHSETKCYSTGIKYESRCESFKWYNSNIIVIKYLIGHGADINSKGDKDQTPLHYAVSKIVSKYDMEIIKYLIEKGADIDAKDIEGKTPLDLATDNGYKDLLSILSKKN